jgi:hypothetical protein
VIRAGIQRVWNDRRVSKVAPFVDRAVASIGVAAIAGAEAFELSVGFGVRIATFLVELTAAEKVATAPREPS